MAKKQQTAPVHGKPVSWSCTTQRKLVRLFDDAIFHPIRLGREEFTFKIDKLKNGQWRLRMW